MIKPMIFLLFCNMIDLHQNVRVKMIVLRNLISLVIRERNFKTPYVFLSTSDSYKEDKIIVGKYNINYLKVGHGTHKVLCIPGALGSIWTDFKHQIEGFDREKFTLIAWDLPGYGKSMPAEREFDMTDCFGHDADVALQFMKALNISKFSVMGWSYGGAVSLNFAVKHPEAIQKLVVWGTSSFRLAHEIEFMKKIRDVRTWPDRTRDPMIELYGEERFFKLWAEIVDIMAADYHKDRGLLHHGLKNMKIPTLILYGQKDPLIDKTHVSYLHSVIQGSRVHLYPEGKHNIHMRYAADFNRRVQEFLLEA